MNEADFDKVVDEIFNNKDFEKSDTEIETYESMEELKFPQEYKDGGLFILDDLNENNWMILEYKLCSKDLDMITYLFS